MQQQQKQTRRVTLAQTPPLSTPLPSSSVYSFPGSFPRRRLLVIAEQTSPANLRSHQRKRATYSVSPIRGRRVLEGQQAADGTGRAAASAARGGIRRRESRVWVLVARVFLRLSYNNSSVLTPVSYFPAPNGICIKPVGPGVAPPVTPRGTVLRALLGGGLVSIIIS